MKDDRTRLQYWRERRFMSKRELARKAHVNINTIINIESRKTRYPRREVIQKLANALDIPLDDLAEYRMQKSLMT